VDKLSKGRTLNARLLVGLPVPLVLNLNLPKTGNISRIKVSIQSGSTLLISLKPG